MQRDSYGGSGGLKQAQVLGLLQRVAPQGVQQARDEGGAHHRLLFAQGIGQGQGRGGDQNAPAMVNREFPAGSYIVRMDQPYSRIADALLDYQYWAPNDPQRNPYDDTGWTFPEAFGLQAVRVTDPKVLDVAMEPVKGTPMPLQTGATGAGTVFAINYSADNAFITLRYQLKNAGPNPRPPSGPGRLPSWGNGSQRCGQCSPD